MNMRFDEALAAGAILCAEESDVPVAAWSLDELDQFSDLESVRSAWSRSDEPGD